MLHVKEEQSEIKPNVVTSIECMITEFTMLKIWDQILSEKGVFVYFILLGWNYVSLVANS